MRTFNILEVMGIVSIILLAEFAALGSWFIVEYNKLSDKLNAADAVIRQVSEDEPDYFMDVLMEGDTWYEYSK